MIRVVNYSCGGIPLYDMGKWAGFGGGAVGGYNGRRLSNVSPLSLWSSRLESIRNKSGYIVDMDGVLTRGNQLVPGADKFLDWIQKSKKKYLFLTNSSDKSPQMIKEKFQRLGVSVPAETFFTSAMATAEFVANQTPNGKAFVIGEPILKLELEKKRNSY